MSTTILFLSIAVGVSLFTLVILFGFLYSTYKINADLLKWFLLPTFGYGIALGLNAFIQSLTCGSVQIKQIAMGSLTIPIAILFFLLLTLISFVRSPVEAAVPASLRAKYGGLFAIAFYMFWAGMFGESIASGFAQSCPQVGKALPK